MTLLLFDPRTSGAAGDLLIAALLDTQKKEFSDEFCNTFQQLLRSYDPDFKVTVPVAEQWWTNEPLLALPANIPPDL